MFDYNHLTFSEGDLSLPTTPNSTLTRGTLSKSNGILSNSCGHLAKPNTPGASMAPSRASIYASNYGVVKSLASLIFITVVALVMGVLATLLLFKLHSNQLLSVPSPSGLLSNKRMYADMLEVAVTTTTLVAVLDFCCVLVCTIQFFFCAKILKVPQGEERALNYLKSSASVRFIAVSGFFVSIPAYLISLLFYMMMEFSSTPAIISMTITGCGVIFCIASVIQSIYCWRCEKTRANISLSVGYEGKKLNDSELSTLV